MNYDPNLEEEVELEEEFPEESDREEFEDPAPEPHDL